MVDEKRRALLFTTAPKAALGAAAVVAGLGQSDRAHAQDARGRESAEAKLEKEKQEWGEAFATVHQLYGVHLNNNNGEIYIKDVPFSVSSSVKLLGFSGNGNALEKIATDAASPEKKKPPRFGGIYKGVSFVMEVVTQKTHPSHTGDPALKVYILDKKSEIVATKGADTAYTLGKIFSGIDTQAEKNYHEILDALKKVGLEPGDVRTFNPLSFNTYSLHQTGETIYAPDYVLGKIADWYMADKDIMFKDSDNNTFLLSLKDKKVTYRSQTYNLLEEKDRTRLTQSLKQVMPN